MEKDNKTYLYMMVDKTNAYRLPIAVAESVAELAQLTGQKPNTISCIISKHRKEGTEGTFIKICMEDEDNET